MLSLVFLSLRRSPVILSVSWSHCWHCHRDPGCHSCGDRIGLFLLQPKGQMVISKGVGASRGKEKQGYCRGLEPCPSTLRMWGHCPRTDGMGCGDGCGNIDSTRGSRQEPTLGDHERFDISGPARDQPMILPSRPRHTPL